MAVVLGTNSGFVTVSPSANPGGSVAVIDSWTHAQKDEAPVGSGKITEIGWWCDTATGDLNFEVGLYDHDAGNDKPDNRLYVDDTNAKGVDAGWKTVAVDWAITAGTTYWIAVQLDNGTATSTDYSADSGERFCIKSGQTTLTDPFGAASSYLSNFAVAIYAKWEAGTTYSELSGTVAAASTVSGNLDTTAISALAGTIAATSSVSGNLGSTTVGLDPTATVFTKRLIVAGNNQIQYEDV